MRQSLTLKARGLYTFPSELAAPDGALSKADNVVIDRENVVEPRRGFDRLTYGFGTGETANKLFFYKSQILAHYATDKFGYYDAGVGWTSNVGFNPPASGVKVRAAEANQNFYFTSSAGIYKLDTHAATPTLAGAYKALGATTATSETAASFILNHRFAYRIVWGYKDANDNLLLGAPSQRVIHTIGTASKGVDITIQIPDGITTTWFFQVYRSGAVDGDADETPSDELGLIYEDNPTTAQITAKSLTMTDITPDSLRGADLYTNANQQGLAQANERPPLAQDIAVYQGHTFFANTTGKHRYILTLIAAMSGEESVTIAGITYTEGSSFTRVSGSSTVSEDIRGTAEALVKAINADTNQTVYAYYISSEDELPGKILLEERAQGGAAFNILVSNTTIWSPTFADSVTANTSSNDRRKNGLYYSKANQPEAVPLGSYVLVGSADQDIQRIIPLRDSLIIFKEDGIFKLIGDSPASFRVDLADSTSPLLAPESAVVLNNQIFCLTVQGVVAVNEAGIPIRSRYIENDLLRLQGVNPTVLETESFGVAYESERKYLLFVPSASGDTAPTQAYVYNFVTDSWTRWDLAKKAGGINPADNKLYLANSNDAFTVKELKSYTYLDYVDFGFTATISVAAGTLLTMTGTDNITPGDVIYQSSSVFATVSEVDSVAGTVTVSRNAGFAAGAVTVYKAISTKVAWVPFTGGNPGALKQFSETALLFKRDFTGSATVKFASDESPALETEVIAGTEVGTWGSFSWGSVPWGGETSRRPFRLLVPRNKQRCSQLTIQFETTSGYTSYQLYGISVVFNDISTKVRRA